MKRSNSIFPALIVISILCFWMSPTSTKHRVLKSFETLFNLEDGSLLKAYESIKVNTNSGTSSDSDITNHSVEAQEYFEEICLKDESGNTFDEPFKWKQDIKIYVSGYQPEYMTDELENIVDELNGLIDPINLSFVTDKSKANMFVFLGSDGSFKSNYPMIDESDLEGSWGYFEIHPKKAYLMVDMVSTSGDEEKQKSILREELTQSLGFCNDSWKYSNSVFYQGPSSVTEYSDLDKEIIQMLYNN